MSENENGKTFREHHTDGAFPVGTGAWRHSEKSISHHYNLSISLETAAHLLNKCWFSIISCLLWFIPFCIFPPEGLFASPSLWISVGGKKYSRIRHEYSPCLHSVSHKPLTPRKILTFPLYLQDFAYIRCLTLEHFLLYLYFERFEIWLGIEGGWCLLSVLPPTRVPHRGPKLLV